MKKEDIGKGVGLTSSKMANPYRIAYGRIVGLIGPAEKGNFKLAVFSTPGGTTCLVSIKNLRDLTPDMKRLLSYHEEKNYNRLYSFDAEANSKAIEKTTRGKITKENLLRGAIKAKEQAWKLSQEYNPSKLYA